MGVADQVRDSGGLRHPLGKGAPLPGPALNCTLDLGLAVRDLRMFP